MNADWPTVRLDHLCERITVGHVGPMIDEYVEDGVAFLRSQNIRPFQVDPTNIRYVSPAFHWKLRKSALRPGDVVVVRTGYPGAAAVVPSWLSEANCADLVVITPGKDLDAAFLAAAFNSTWGVASVAGRLVGSAQQHFNVGAAKRLELHLPPLPTQRKIAAILSAYDDLIDNNTRRIQILEEMAQAIYRAWFVDFRYPGHEGVPMVDSELGPLPQGWTVVSFTDLAEVLSGGTPRTADPMSWGGSIPFFTPRDAPDGIIVATTEKHITDIGLSRCNSRLYASGTVFITARGTVGKVVMNAVPMAMNQSCYAVQGKDLPQEWVLFALRNRVDYLRANTGGATFDTIIVDTFRRMRSILPPREIAEAFAAAVSPMIRAVIVLGSQIAAAQSARDLLLPRLISGEIDVSDLDIDTSGLVA